MLKLKFAFTFIRSILKTTSQSLLCYSVHFIRKNFTWYNFFELSGRYLYLNWEWWQKALKQALNCSHQKAVLLLLGEASHAVTNVNDFILCHSLEKVIFQCLMCRVSGGMTHLGPADRTPERYAVSSSQCPCCSCLSTAWTQKQTPKHSCKYNRGSHEEIPLQSWIRFVMSARLFLTNPKT